MRVCALAVCVASLALSSNRSLAWNSHRYEAAAATIDGLAAQLSPSGDAQEAGATGGWLEPPSARTATAALVLLLLLLAFLCTFLVVQQIVVFLKSNCDHA